jgi:hypothetical protein
VLVVTFKPAVEDAWQTDLESHVDFDGWLYMSKSSGSDPRQVSSKKPLVYFGSFQDLLGRDDAGNIKSNNEWLANNPPSLLDKLTGKAAEVEQKTRNAIAKEQERIKKLQSEISELEKGSKIDIPKISSADKNKGTASPTDPMQDLIDCITQPDAFAYTPPSAQPKMVAAYGVHKHKMVKARGDMA